MDLPYARRLMARIFVSFAISALLLSSGGRVCLAEGLWGSAGCACEEGCHGWFGRGAHCGHHCGGHHRLEGRDAHFNCGCNGSYKFPVPPLYTFHWPGMYSAQLMTDYHSPYRFPPLKPYTDEAIPVEELDSAAAANASRRDATASRSVLRTAVSGDH
jgi:hypothetical protein